MGKKEFTYQEANRIKELLYQKTNAIRDEQKSLRSNIRNIGFYITDFDYSFAGFTEYDFDDLVRKGEITIIDEDRT